MPSLIPALEQFVGSALQPHNCCQALEACLGLGVDTLAVLICEWIRGRYGSGSCLRPAAPSPIPLAHAPHPHACFRFPCRVHAAHSLHQLCMCWYQVVPLVGAYARVQEVIPSAEYRASRLDTAVFICKDLAQRSQLVGLQVRTSQTIKSSRAVSCAALCSPAYPEGYSLSVNNVGTT